MYTKLKNYILDKLADVKYGILDYWYDFTTDDDGDKLKNWTKWLLIGLAVSVVVGITTSYAHATNSHQNPRVSQGQGQDQGQDQVQDQVQRQSAAARAAAAANANSNATSSGSVASSSNDRALGLSLPQPVQSQRLPSAGSVCALTNGDASAFGWNFVSSSSARQVIDGLCVAEMQAAALEDQCKFRTATAIRTWIAKQATSSRELAAVQVTEYNGEVMVDGRLVPQRTTSLASALGKFLEEAGADKPWEHEVNYTASQCAILKNPVVVGPAGPQGDRGPRGYRGKQGPAGEVKPVCIVCGDKR